MYQHRTDLQSFKKSLLKTWVLCRGAAAAVLHAAAMLALLAAAAAAAAVCKKDAIPMIESVIICQ
jgi:NADPH-dependent 2,4-dienoyl-CoA reductase/sulfur reductase-like enzyme